MVMGNSKTVCEVKIENKWFSPTAPDPFLKSIYVFWLMGQTTGLNHFYAVQSRKKASFKVGIGLFVKSGNNMDRQRNQSPNYR